MSDEEINSIKSYAEVLKQRDLITQLLRQTFISIPPEQYEEMTEMILTKIKITNMFREHIKSTSKKAVEETAKLNGVSESDVVDSFVYFFLVVENSLLVKQIQEMKEQE